MMLMVLVIVVLVGAIVIISGADIGAIGR